jgi:hypothetical protein
MVKGVEDYSSIPNGATNLLILQPDQLQCSSNFIYNGYRAYFHETHKCSTALHSDPLYGISCQTLYVESSQVKTFTPLSKVQLPFH